MSIKKTYGIFAANAIFASVALNGGNVMDKYDPTELKPTRKKTTTKPIKKEIIPWVPAGTKEYAFDALGNFANKNTQPMLKEDVIFKCVALNDKNAIRKYSAWAKNNTQ